MFLMFSVSVITKSVLLVVLSTNKQTNKQNALLDDEFLAKCFQNIQFCYHVYIIEIQLNLYDKPVGNENLL